MIKFVMCITRHPDMTREDFKDYWMNQHAPFFMQNTDAYETPNSQYAKDNQFANLKFK